MTTAYASEPFFHRLLSKALAAGASDVHLKVGQPPGARVRGDLVYFRGDRILPEDTAAATQLLLGGDPEELLEDAHEICFAYDAGEAGRFRVTAYRQRGAFSLVMRAVPQEAPTPAALGLPGAAAALAARTEGLVVIAGGSASGKTATMAALVRQVVESSPRHVVTLEDPIEILQEDRRGSVCQRAVGIDVATLAAGLRAAPRQDADVIAVDDLRAPDAVLAALAAAELGHLVLAVVPARDAAHAVAELMSLGREAQDFPARLAAVLEGVVAQRLRVKQDGTGLALACEVLLGTPAARAAVRRGAEDIGRALGEIMESGAGAAGMQTFAMHERKLATEGLITPPKAPAGP